MSRSNRPVNPGAENALDRMKLEVASELGIADRVRSQGWNTMTSADCGRVGGHMVRRMIEQYESGMSGTTTQATNSTLTAQFDANKQS
ncbi:alpha/beta-type small acid-soluble spore protein [Pelosinus sp. UFO1]|uniref:alpha/beta-type small acid-soluble spore protein n=1 Tax=Pelosinus sp. UFO1 TaxID=484770 RepID=UPI0004D1AC68|nr:alpha/beta-type small acid-soluble spore protein [Pelosinus sp. UFO1]AIF54241.1 small acid-soluble spore protein alpha/beta type [Pelosinus sp. UFO1]